MPRLGTGMPIVTEVASAPVLAVQDFFWLNDVSGELTPIHTASRTNLIPNTSASGMTGSGTTISSSIGPDGTNNGIKMTETTATSQHYKGFANIPVVAGLTYAVSYYIKKGTYNSVAIYTNTSQINSNATINFANETVTVVGVGIISNSDFILDEGNGWYRVGYSVVAAGTGVTTIYTATKDLSSYEGSTDNYTEFFGPQLEQDSRVSAYIPTSGSTVTVATTLNDTHNAWDYDSANLTLEEDPDSEGSWQRPSNMVLNHDFADLGAEMVQNGSFDNGTTNWTKSGTTSATQEIVNGALKMYTGTADDNANSMSYTSGYSMSGVSGKTYRLRITASDFTAGGSGKIRLDGVYLSGAAGNIPFSAGTQDVYFVAYRNFASINFFGSSHSHYYTIDNVSLKQVDPNDRWTKSAEWSISEGKATCSGGASKTLYQSNILPLGTLYEIKFTVSSYTSGYLSAFSGDWDALGVIDSVGTFVRRSVSLGTNIGLVGNSFIGTVDNITVKEYAAMPLDV